MDEAFIKKLYYAYNVDRGLTELEFIDLVKDAYLELKREAKAGNLVFYGDLEVFQKLRERGYRSNELLVILGAIVGACSEHEVVDGHPLISSIVINRDTRKPSLGYFYLSKAPPSLSRKNWEDRNIRPPEIIMRQRDVFWLYEVQKVHEWWRKADIEEEL